MYQLRDQVPADLRRVLDVDVDLQLVPPTGPGTVRAPDIVVVTRAGLARRRQEGGVLRADEIRLAIEIVSPGSRRVDKVFKHSEYADAGIPHCWIVDLGEPGEPGEPGERITLTAHHLAGPFGYRDPGPVVGTFATTEPFPVRIDLDALV